MLTRAWRHWLQRAWANLRNGHHRRADRRPTRARTILCLEGLEERTLPSGSPLAPNPTDHLVVTSQPTTPVAAGTPFSVTVKAEDSTGTVDPSFNGTVTVFTFGTSPGGTLTATASNGVAMFSGIIVRTASTFTQLQFASPGVISGSSNSINVTAAAATQLVVSPPFNPLTGTGFTATVTAEDQFGNTDPTFSGQITLALASSPGGAALTGTLTAPAMSGIATFNGLKLNQAGGGYTLKATSSGLAAGTSAAFPVSTDQLVVTGQPLAMVTAGSPFSVTVSAENGSGTVDSTFNGTVTIPGSSTSTPGVNNPFSGTVTATAVNGVATFSGIIAHTANPTTTIQFSSPGTLDGSTNTFSVKGGTATQLAVSMPTGNVLTGSTFTLTVKAEDQFGNLAGSFGGQVALKPVSGPSGATLGGTTFTTATGGIATLPGLTLSQAGTGYVIRATSTGLTSANSPAFAVTTDQLVVTGEPPNTVAAGTPFALTVKAENASGTVDASFNGTVTIAAPPSAFPGPTSRVGGTLTATAVSGVATFSGVFVTSAGSGTMLQASSPGVGPGLTSGFNVTGLSATHLSVFVNNSTNLLTGAPFDVSVEPLDQYGNFDSTFHGPVSVAIATGPAGATLSGFTSATSAFGSVDVSGLTLNKPGSYTLQVTSPGLTPATSFPLTLTTDQLVVTTQPPFSIAAGTPFSVTVAAENSSGAVDSSFNGTVIIPSLSFPGLSQGNPFGGTFKATAVNGVATFSGVIAQTSGPDVTIPFSSTMNVASGTSAPFNVTPLAATHLSVALPTGNLVGSTANLLVGAPFTVTVNAQDQFGNTDPTFHGVVSLKLASGPAGAMLSGTLTATAVNGVATFSGLTVNQPGTNYTMTATATGLTAGTSPAFTVTRDQIVVTVPPPSTVTAGTPFDVTVAAEDGNGTIDTSFNGIVEVSFIFSFPIGLTYSVVAVNGIATFSGITVDQADSGYQLSFTSPNVGSGSFNNFNVLPLAATHLTASLATPLVSFGAQGSTNVLVGAPFGVTVNAQDQFGNTDPSFNGPITLALTGGPAGATLGGTLMAAAANGTFTFNGLTLNQVGTNYVITATATGLASGSTVPFPVTMDQLVLTVPPPSSVTPGTPFGLTVTAEDGSGNTDTSFHGVVTASSFISPIFSTNLGGTLTAPAVNGVATFSSLLLNAGIFTSITLSSPGVGSATTGFIGVTPQAATHLVVGFTSSLSSSFVSLTGTPTVPNILTNTPFSVIVNAEDQFGNTDSTFNGPVTVALGAGPSGATLGGTLTGIATFGRVMFTGLTLNQAGTGYALQATNSTLAPGTSPFFTVTQDQLVVTAQPATQVAAGAPFGLTVVAQAPSGGVDTSFNGTVTVALSSSFTTTPGLTLGGTLTAPAVKGVATFSGLTLNKASASSGYTLALTANSVSSATTNQIKVTGASATKLMVEQPPVHVTVGVPFTVSIAAVDGNGNPDPSFQGSVTLTLGNNPGGAMLKGTTMVNAINGVATFSGLTLNQSAKGYTLIASTSTLPSVTTNPFDVSPAGVAVQLVLTTPPPSGVVAGNPFGFAVTAEDGAGTVDTTFNSNVTVALLPGSGNSTLGGSLMVPAVNGVATFSGLTLSKTSLLNFLLASATGLAPVETGLISVASAAATHLLVTMQPATSVNVGAPFGLVVSAEDGNGNVDPSFNGPVTVGLSNNPGGATLSGTLMVNAINGIANFSGLTVNQAGNGYTLSVTTTAGPSGTTTSSFNASTTIVASKLVVTSQPPGSVSVNGPFSFAVTAEDGSGNTATSFTGTVTVSLMANPGGATLGGTLMATAVNGVATFSGLTLNQVANGYTLSVSSGTLTPTTTNAFNVTQPVVATKLVVTTQPPASVAENGTFGFSVSAEDNSGNVATSFTGTVTVSLMANPGGAMLGGTLMATAVNGVATFSGLTLNQVANGYTLSVSSGTLTPTTTNAFNVTPVATKLMVTTQPPTRVNENSTFGFAVTAEDGSGNVATSFTGTVTVTLMANPGGATLGGTLMATAVNGVATFSGLTLNQVANGYTLSVSSGTLTPATTNAINVPPVMATKLIVTSQPPGSVTVNSPFGVSVTAEDNAGNIATSFNGTVTVALMANPGSATLGGTLMATAVNGVATFSGLTLSKIASGYTLSLTATGLTAATTASINVVAATVPSGSTTPTPAPAAAKVIQPLAPGEIGPLLGQTFSALFSSLLSGKSGLLGSDLALLIDLFQLQLQSLLGSPNPGLQQQAANLADQLASTPGSGISFR
jgi:hypothetical protein